jgi:hypothetical protein
MRDVVPAYVAPGPPRLSAGGGGPGRMERSTASGATLPSVSRYAVGVTRACDSVGIGPVHLCERPADMVPEGLAALHRPHLYRSDTEMFLT